jgi:hypothetical protein
MDDFKSLESTMSTQISELREIIAQLMQAKASSAPPPPLVAPASTEQVEVGVEDEDTDKDKEARSSTKGNKKGEFPHWYSPDPPVPHPHINNRGDPPKLDALNFSQ